MKTLVLDDDSSLLNGMKFLLSKFPDVELCGTAQNIASAKALIEKHNPELLFLDIKLDTDGSTSFELVEELIKENKLKAEVIFMTGYESLDFAIRAIKLSSLDYLTKPFKEEDLAKAITKAKNKVTAWDTLAEKVKSAYNLEKNPDSDQNIIHLPTYDGRNETLRLAEILYIESTNQGKWTTLFFKNHHQKISHCTHPISFFKENLTIDQGFFTIHQSRVINLKYLKTYDIQKKLVTLLHQDGSPVQVEASRRIGRNLKEYLESNMKNVNQSKDWRDFLNEIWKKLRGY